MQQAAPPEGLAIGHMWAAPGLDEGKLPAAQARSRGCMGKAADDRAAAIQVAAADGFYACDEL